MSLTSKSFDEALKTHKPLRRSGFAQKSREDAPGRSGVGSRSGSGKAAVAPQMRRSGSGFKAKPDANLAAWGRRVRKRDGNVCRFPSGCQTGDTRIDPHHIATRGRRPDLAYVDANGICLCRTHHDLVHAQPVKYERMGLLSDRTRELAQQEGTLGVR